MKHTPGPWRFLDHMRKENSTELLDDLAGHSPATINIIGGKGEKRWGICTIQSYYPAREWDQHKANLDLILAAPMMLEALERFVAADGISGWQNALPLARAAIAQAKGEQT